MILNIFLLVYKIFTGSHNLFFDAYTKLFYGNKTYIDFYDAVIIKKDFQEVSQIIKFNNFKKKNCETIMFYAGVHNSVEIVKHLVSNGYNSGQAIYGVCYNHFDNLDLFIHLENICVANGESIDYARCIIMCCSKGNLNILKHIINNTNYDLTLCNYNALTIAGSAYQSSIVEYLCNNGGFNKKVGERVISYCISECTGDIIDSVVETIKYLEKLGCDVIVNDISLSNELVTKLHEKNCFDVLHKMLKHENNFAKIKAQAEKFVSSKIINKVRSVNHFCDIIVSN